MDNTKSSSPSFRALLDGNIFEIVWTYFRVQMDLFRVQNWYFWAHRPKEVEIFWETYQEMDDARSLGPILLIWIYFEMVGTFFRVQTDLFRVQMDLFRVQIDLFRLQMDLFRVKIGILNPYMALLRAYRT